MARVTVEDCIDKVDNRFDLILLTAHRARELSVGGTATLPTNGEKMPVVALRELAAENIKADELESSLIQSMQTFVERSEAPAETTTADVSADSADADADLLNAIGLMGDTPADSGDKEQNADADVLNALENMFEDADESDIED